MKRALMTLCVSYTILSIARMIGGTPATIAALIGLSVYVFTCKRS